MAWYIPILIFAARVCDVSLGTIRMMLVVGGHRWVSAILGFFEVLLWVFAVGGAIRYLGHISAVLAYAGGFAAGIVVGMVIEDRLAFGLRMVRVINADQEKNVAASLREQGFRVTRVEGSGRNGPVEIAFLVVKRRRLNEVKQLIEKFAPGAFLTVERVDRATGELELGTLRLAGWRTRGFLRK